MKIALFCTGEWTSPLRKDIIYAPLPLFDELVNGLADKGHEVFVYAPEGSKFNHPKVKTISLDLKSFDKAGYNNMWGSFHDQEVLTVYEQFLLAQLVKDEKKYNFDAIHIHHNLIHFLPFLNLVNTPVFFTLHDPLNDKRKFLIEKCPWSQKAKYISISNNQRKDMPNLNYVATVYNGLDLSGYNYYEKNQNYFAFIGRVAYEKGAHHAVQAVNNADERLKIIGPRWMGNEYWDKEIKPNLTEKIEFLDKLEQEKTRPIVGQAKALLFPIEWEEPFGLVMIEAMAGGTPVIAFDRGSVREVIKEGVTGFVVKDIKGMVEAMKKINSIDRRACREHVENNFSLQKMINEYEKTYKKIK